MFGLKQTKRRKQNQNGFVSSLVWRKKKCRWIQNTFNENRNLFILYFVA